MSGLQNKLIFKLLKTNKQKEYNSYVWGRRALGSM